MTPIADGSGAGQASDLDARSPDPRGLRHEEGSRYVRIEQLGAGGMGVVWRAYDPKLQREVALKTLHADRTTEEDRARLVREARTLARLSDPNVISVYDVEEGGGDITIAMELVEGETLDAWLANTSSVAQIVDVLIGVGHGLAAAHAEGILHRDVKPGNVIVGRDGRARVVDFGLAQASGDIVASAASVGPVSSSNPSLTTVGSVMGTPLYMAPEQHGGLALGPAADQFAFCVMAWQALAGSPPYRGSTIVELAEAKLDGPPPFPRRRGVTDRLERAIVRGLAPAPDLRWPDMMALVDAMAPRRRGHAWAWIAVGTLVACAAALGVASNEDARCTGAQAGLVPAWNTERREAVERAILGTGAVYATDAARTVRRGLDDYAQVWATTHRDACEATMVRGEQEASVLDLRMACLVRARDALTATVDLLARADGEVASRVDALVDGLPQLERCSDVSALERGLDLPLAHEEERVAAARARIAATRALRLAGKYREAIEEGERAIAAARGCTYAPVWTEAWLELGDARYQNMEYEAAESALRRAFESALRNGQDDEAFAASASLVGVIGDGLDRYAEAHAFERAARGLHDRIEDPVQAARLASAQALLYGSEYRHEESEILLRAALDRIEAEPGVPLRGTFSLRVNLGRVLSNRRKVDEAIEVSRALLEDQLSTLGDAHPDVAMTRSNLGTILGLAERNVERVVELEIAAEIFERTLGADHPTTTETQWKLGEARAAIDDDPAALAAAIDAGLRSVEAHSRWAGADHLRTTRARIALATSLRDAGRLAEAETQLERALESFDRTLPPDHMGRAAVWMVLADVHRAQGALRESIESRRSSLEILMHHDHPAAPDAAVLLADALLRVGDAAGALPVAERAWRIRQHDPVHVRSASAWVLARALDELGRDPERATFLARDALADFDSHPGRSATAEEIRTWLRRRERRQPAQVRAETTSPTVWRVSLQ
jgi:eukaryotic-like serine/threonine-protein kinase